MSLPRVLVIDDILGWSADARRETCLALGLQEAGIDGHRSGECGAIAEAVFHSGQRVEGHRLLNDLPACLAIVEDGWGPAVQPSQRWALVLLDLAFSHGGFQGERPDPQSPRSWPREAEPTFGLGILAAMADRWPDPTQPGRTEIPVVVMSGRPRRDLEGALNDLGNRGYLQRERSAPNRIERLDSSAELRLQLRDLLYFHGLFPDKAQASVLGGGSATARSALILGDSLPLLQALRLARQAAASAAPCLVVGEPGTGKELFCRLLHDLSPRAGRALVGLNCANLSENLLEDELFGHVVGAFTGATSARAGHFEQADGGTLFLDEIADLPASSQARVLRAVESGEVRRLGDDRVRRVNVRLVAATNRDLHGEVAAGRFRPDLLTRLEGLTIELPPLRSRVGDVPALFDHYLELETQKQGGVPKRRISPAVYERLAGHTWAGNVRELQRVAERVASARRFSAEIGVGDIALSEPRRSPAALTQVADPGEPPSLDAVLALLLAARIPGSARELRGLLTRALDAFGRVVMGILEAGLNATRDPLGRVRTRDLGDLRPTATIKLLLDRQHLTGTRRGEAQRAKDEFKRLARLFVTMPLPRDLSQVLRRAAESRARRPTRPKP